MQSFFIAARRMSHPEIETMLAVTGLPLVDWAHWLRDINRVRSGWFLESDG